MGIMLNLIGVIIAFVIVIVLIRKKFNFGLSLILGSIVLGIFSLQEINIIEIPKAIGKAIIYDFDEQVFDLQTIELAILLTIIYILAKCMQETGAIQKMIKSLGSIFYKGGLLGLIPAVYGLMPVPGGALFSAPLIEKEGKKFKNIMGDIEVTRLEASNKPCMTYFKNGVLCNTYAFTIRDNHPKFPREKVAFWET